MPNTVFIATSLDGFIADRDGGLGWLETVPNPDGDDGGFADFTARVDAVVMGRVTFETMVGFDVGWPYPVPGLILSTTLSGIPVGFEKHVTLCQGSPSEIVAQAAERGFQRLYIDGGTTIQGFLAADLIDEMIVTEVPILLGGGSRLFGALAAPLAFDLIEARSLRGQLLQKHYRRRRA